MINKHVSLDNNNGIPRPRVTSQRGVMKDVVAKELEQIK